MTTSSGLTTHYYLRNPMPKTPQSVLKEKLLQTVETDWFRAEFRHDCNMGSAERVFRTGRRPF